MVEAGTLSTMRRKINMVVLTIAKIIAGIVTTTTLSPYRLQDGFPLSQMGFPNLHLDTLLDNLIKLRIIQLLLMAMAVNLEGRTDIMAKLSNTEVVIRTEAKVAMNIEAVVDMVAIVKRGQLVKQIRLGAFVSNQCRLKGT